MRLIISLAAFSLFASVGVAESTPPCPQPSPEYCSVGCEDLGAWVVEPLEMVEAGYAKLLALDPLERISAFLVQTPRGALLLRRERGSSPAARPAASEPHWEIEEFGSQVDAAATAHVKGGWVYATNGGDTAAVRVWWVACPVDSDPRRRSVKR